MGDLRLGLSGRALLFKDGRPYCLVCGAKPFARRSIPCKDADYAMKKSRNLNSILEWMNPALAYFNWRRKVSFSIDAPLCVRHFWRGLFGEFLIIGLFVAAVIGVFVAWWKDKIPKGPSGTGSLLKAALIGIVIGGGWVLSRLSRPKPVLPCTVKREADNRVLLIYPGDAPARN